MSISEKYIIEKVERWVNKVKIEYSPPSGTFERRASSIATQLLKDSDSPGQAMKRLSFYMNRAGDKLENKQELEKAKEIIHNKVETDQEKD